MNRFELIARLTKRPKGATYQAKGMNCTEAGIEPVASNRPTDRKRGLGVLLRGSWGPMNKPQGLRYNWVNQPEAQNTASIKVPFRQKPHVLTKIAEKWLHPPKR